MLSPSYSITLGDKEFGIFLTREEAIRYGRKRGARGFTITRRRFYDVKINSKSSEWKKAPKSERKVSIVAVNWPPGATPKDFNFMWGPYRRRKPE
jgi:hypothetical protein